MARRMAVVFAFASIVASGLIVVSGRLARVEAADGVALHFERPRPAPTSLPSIATLPKRL